MGDSREVLPHLAQGRQGDDERVDAVVDIPAERSRIDELFEVLVRGADEAEVGDALVHVAQGAEALLLENLQELRLEGEVHVPDLVQEKGPAVGPLKESLLGIHGAGEGAFRMPEKLALEELALEPRAVELHEGFPAVGALGMDVPGQEPLPCTRLPAEENRTLVPACGIDEGEDGLERIRLPVVGDDSRRTLPQGAV